MHDDANKAPLEGEVINDREGEVINDTTSSEQPDTTMAMVIYALYLASFLVGLPHWSASLSPMSIVVKALNG